MNEHRTHQIWTRRDPGVRASDADREAFVERLRRNHADGRLTTDEFQERIDHCYSAKTSGELEELVADLPPERPREPRLRARYLWAVPLLPIVVALIAISAVTGDHHPGFWVVIPFFFLLRLMCFGRYGRWGGWRGPGQQV
jgi:hypothetical protein